MSIQYVTAKGRDRNSTALETACKSCGQVFPSAAQAAAHCALQMNNKRQRKTTKTTEMQPHPRGGRV